LSAPVVSFLDELEKEVKDFQKKHQFVLGEVAKVRGILEVIEQQEKEEAIKLQELNMELLSWCEMQERELEEVRTTDWEEVLRGFESNLKTLKNRLQELEEAQKFAFQWQQTSQQQNMNFEKLKSKIENLNKSIQSIENEENELNNKIKSASLEMQDLEVKSLEISQNLSVYFDNTPLSNWKISIPEKTKELLEWTNKWTNNLSELKHLEAQLLNGVLPISTAKKSLEDLKERKEEWQQSLNKLTVEKESLTTLYQAVFPKESPTQHRERLESSIQQKKGFLQDQNLVSARLSTEVNHLMVQISNIQKICEVLNVEQEGLKKQLDEWLDAQNQLFDWNLTWTFLLEKSESLTLQKQALEDLITISKNNLEVAEKLKNKEVEESSLHEVNRPEMLEEEVLVNMEMLKLKRDELLQIRSGFEAKLKHDDAQRLSVESLLKAYNAQLEVFHQWSKLNDLIGSAEGHKFRQIVQELTLDYLLVFANDQLKSLTARYKVERIPNSLGLQVVDGDMGEEVRTVFSLSGGETFLVSLALALGLSELTGSIRQAESLFIDEGFGALDPATLAVAMDALDRLHYQGRKVGVISHVQEMNERIPVRIEVMKRTGGRSEISVRG
jgi:exonuclease SbcC